MTKAELTEVLDKVKEELQRQFQTLKRETGVSEVPRSGKVQQWKN